MLLARPLRRNQYQPGGNHPAEPRRDPLQPAWRQTSRGCGGRDRSGLTCAPRGQATRASDDARPGSVEATRVRGPSRPEEYIDILNPAILGDEMPQGGQVLCVEPAGVEDDFLVHRKLLSDPF